MRIELRDKPEEKKEPVAKVWLGEDSCGEIVLYYQLEGHLTQSLAYFSGEERRFHVFNRDFARLGYKVSSTDHPL